VFSPFSLGLRRAAARGQLIVGAGLLVAVAHPSVAMAAPQQAGVVAPAAPGVDFFVKRALANAPSLEARRERLQAARAALPAAGILPDPMIELEYRAAGFPRYTIGRDPMSMAGASLRQDWVTRGRRQVRKALASAEVNQRLAEGQVTAADLVANVRLQYAQLYRIDREREALDDAQQLIDLLIETASSRYATGATDQAAVLRAQLEQTRLGERLADLAGDRTLVRATLNRLVNDPPDTPIGPVRELPDPGPGPPGLTAASLPEVAARSAPAVGLREAEVAWSGHRVEASRQELRSNLSFATGLFWQGAFDRMVTFNVGVELPFWRGRRERPMIAAAERELQAARLELADATAEARAEATRLMTEWRVADDQVARYRTAILPQTTATLDATRGSYLGGRADFPAVLEQFRTWIDARVDLVQREIARYSARVRLELLVAPPERQAWLPHDAAISNSKEIFR
jgi:cobalt-zinc-cadmium efflux system outer membrane protein